MTDEHCVACRFWELQPRIVTRDRTNRGQCRRRAPKVVQSEDGRFHSTFPLMPEDSWCGDFEAPKADTADAA